MHTPCRRRSYVDHREHYNQIKPKVQTRWPNGTPLVRAGKPVNRPKLTRRATESNLSTQMAALLSPQSFMRCKGIKEEDEECDVGPSNSVESSMSEHNISSSLEISTHLDIVSGHFKNLFKQLENYLEGDDKSSHEKQFVGKQLADFQEQALQIDFMINELIERGQRLENFLSDCGRKMHWAD